MSGWGC